MSLKEILRGLCNGVGSVYTEAIDAVDAVDAVDATDAMLFVRWRIVREVVVSHQVPYNGDSVRYT